MRFRKGTTDHDGNGKMGGSLKETDMAKAPAKRTTKAAEHTAEVEAAQTAAATSMDPQTGMSVVHDEKPTKAAIERQFKEADAKGDPEAQAIEDARLSREVRGF